MQARKNDKEITGSISGSLDKASGTLTFVERLLREILMYLQSASALKEFLSVFPYLSLILTMFECMIAALLMAISEEHFLPTRIIKVVSLLAILAISIATLVINAPFIPLILTGLGAMNRLWDAGVAIYKRLTMQSDDEDEKKKLNGEIVDKFHLVALSAISLLGFGLSLTMPMVGLPILLGLASYMLLEKFEINPLRWLANKIFSSPFKTNEKEKELEEIQPKKMSTLQIKQAMKKDTSDHHQPPQKSMIERRDSSPIKVIAHRLWMPPQAIHTSSAQLEISRRIK